MYEPITEAHGLKKDRSLTEVMTEVVRIDPESFPESEPQGSEMRRLIQIPVQQDPSPDDIKEEMYYDSLELLACCIEAEAGNQSKYGKALVCDVVLNRVDDRSGLFPDDIWDVIMQKNQFTVVLKGTIFSVDPTEETYNVVKAELENRTNSKILFFTSEGWSQYGTPWKKVEDHYFSTW